MPQQQKAMSLKDVSLQLYELIQKMNKNNSSFQQTFHLFYYPKDGHCLFSQHQHLTQCSSCLQPKTVDFTFDTIDRAVLPFQKFRLNHPTWESISTLIRQSIIEKLKLKTSSYIDSLPYIDQMNKIEIDYLSIRLCVSCSNTASSLTPSNKSLTLSMTGFRCDYYTQICKCGGAGHFKFTKCNDCWGKGIFDLSKPYSIFHDESRKTTFIKVYHTTDFFIAPFLSFFNNYRNVVYNVDYPINFSSFQIDYERLMLSISFVNLNQEESVVSWLSSKIDYNQVIEHQSDILDCCSHYFLRPYSNLPDVFLIHNLLYSLKFCKLFEIEEPTQRPFTLLSINPVSM